MNNSAWRLSHEAKETPKRSVLGPLDGGRQTAGYLEASQNEEVQRRDLGVRDMSGGDRTNKRACATQRLDH